MAKIIAKAPVKLNSLRNRLANKAPVKEVAASKSSEVPLPTPLKKFKPSVAGLKTLVSNKLRVIPEGRYIYVMEFGRPLLSLEVTELRKKIRSNVSASFSMVTVAGEKTHNVIIGGKLITPSYGPPPVPPANIDRHFDPEKMIDNLRKERTQLQQELDRKNNELDALSAQVKALMATLPELKGKTSKPVITRMPREPEPEPEIISNPPDVEPTVPTNDSLPTSLMPDLMDSPPPQDGGPYLIDTPPTNPTPKAETFPATPPTPPPLPPQEPTGPEPIVPKETEPTDDSKTKAKLKRIIDSLLESTNRPRPSATPKPPLAETPPTPIFDPKMRSEPKPTSQAPKSYANDPKIQERVDAIVAKFSDLVRKHIKKFTDLSLINATDSFKRTQYDILWNELSKSIDILETKIPEELAIRILRDALEIKNERKFLPLSELIDNLYYTVALTQPPSEDDKPMAEDDLERLRGTLKNLDTKKDRDLKAEADKKALEEERMKALRNTLRKLQFGDDDDSF